MLEPKPGLPTDPNDVRAFIDIFTDVAGLFVINNESGWYEGWMIHDLRVAPVASALPGGRPNFGTITAGDAAALQTMGTHQSHRPMLPTAMSSKSQVIPPCPFSS